MRINSVKSQNFGLNPSDDVRLCIVKAGIEGADIKPLRKLIGELYPYKYMEMLGDYNNVQGINIVNVCGAKPRIDKVLTPKWKTEYNKHKYPIDSIYTHYNVDKEGQKIWEKHAFDDVVGGNVIFKDLKGKNFKDIIGKLTTKLKEIKTKQDPLSRAMDEFNVGLPEYGRKLSATEYSNIYYACFSDENIH